MTITLNPIAFILAFFLGAGLNTTALAEKADRNKPMDILADRLTHDDIKQVSVYSGNVVLTKGSITLRGDKMVIRQDPEGYQYGVVTGKLASFRQKREGVDQFIEGYGLEIDYNGKTEVVRFIEKANVRRLEKEKAMDDIQGKIVVYDSRSETYTVDGGSSESATGTNPSGRVKVTIQPKIIDETSPQPGSATSGTTAPALTKGKEPNQPKPSSQTLSAPQLRPDRSLNSSK
jgi:lipopolysaccharide export system protein LptA